jgi:hypothetical protein
VETSQPLLVLITSGMEDDCKLSTRHRDDTVETSLPLLVVITSGMEEGCKLATGDRTCRVLVAACITTSLWRICMHNLTVRYSAMVANKKSATMQMSTSDTIHCMATSHIYSFVTYIVSIM